MCAHNGPPVANAMDAGASGLRTRTSNQLLNVILCQPMAPGCQFATFQISTIKDDIDSPLIAQPARRTCEAGACFRLCSQADEMTSSAGRIVSPSLRDETDSRDRELQPECWGSIALWDDEDLAWD